MAGTQTQEHIVHQSGRDADGRPSATTRLTPTQDTSDCVVLCEPDAIIPVIFLPGIMGTNLRREGGGSVAWRPPNMDGVLPILSAIGTLVGFLFRGAATRQEMLSPETTEVDDRGPIDAEGTLEKKEARARGWGALMRSAYHPVMSLMQKDLNALMENASFMDGWSDGQLYRREPSDYGDDRAESATLSDDEIRHAAKYRFEVWGGGYNWLQSNDDSGARIIEYIDRVVVEHYRQEIGAEAEKIKVVLVTHSMGGFVARSMDAIHASDRILGVVHGVMPAVGAPATYKRVRAGFEGVQNIVLGRNAGEVTAIMANSPGALELVPTAEYGIDSTESRQWLKLGGIDGGGNWSLSLPQADPYREIYQSRAWYGLVPQSNVGLLDPAGLTAAHGEMESIGGGLDVTALFDDRIEEVRGFHDDISMQYPEPAYVHYGDDTGMRAWGRVHWAGGDLPASGVDPLGAQLTKDNGKGKITLSVGGAPVALKIAGPDAPGDETVPAISGRAPGLASIAGNFVQGDQGAGTHAGTDKNGKSIKGYDHQGSYKDARAQWATVYGVVKIAQNADWA